MLVPRIRLSSSRQTRCWMLSVHRADPALLDNGARSSSPNAGRFRHEKGWQSSYSPSCHHHLSFVPLVTLVRLGERARDRNCIFVDAISNHTSQLPSHAQHVSLGIRFMPEFIARNASVLRALRGGRGRARGKQRVRGGVETPVVLEKRCSLYWRDANARTARRAFSEQ